MTEISVEAASAAYRKKRMKRVKRIKRIIVGICITLLILPTILSTFLLFKVFSLEKEITRLSDEKTKTEQQDTVQAKLKEEPQQTSQPTEAPKQKKVYLTFDDGPGTETEKILDVLKKKDVKATFFVTGKEDDTSKKIIKRIVKDGHTLGMHSYSHIFDEVYESEKAFTKDLDKIYQYLKDITGTSPEWYRFPGGSSTQNIDLPIQTFIDVLDHKNISYMDWNVISPDISNSSATKEQVVSGIVDGVSQFETSVVLMYDSADKPLTVKALPLIIKKLKQENYELLPIDSDTPLIRHTH